MAAITGMACVDERNKNVACDAYEDDVALLCPRCGHPLLASTSQHQRGSSPDHPATCRKCRFECWVEVDRNRQTLRLYARSVG